MPLLLALEYILRFDYLQKKMWFIAHIKKKKCEREKKGENNIQDEKTIESGGEKKNWEPGNWQNWKWKLATIEEEQNEFIFGEKEMIFLKSTYKFISRGICSKIEQIAAVLFIFLILIRCRSFSRWVFFLHCSIRIKNATDGWGELKIYRHCVCIRWYFARFGQHI